MKIQLKRSNVLLLDKAKEPTAEQMEYGELAVNYNGEDPAVFIKDSNDNIIRIAGSGNISSGDTPSGPDKPSTGNDVGDLFFDTVNNTLYYWNGTEWVPIEANKSENIFVGTLAEVDFYISPQSRPEGFLWWNVDDETLYVWYNNNGSPEWRPATPIDDNDGASVTISDTAPSTGDSDIGDLWWDSSDGRLYIYYEDSSSAQWVDASPKGDSIEDAPADGNQYARKNNNWSVVTSSGGGGGGTTINYNGASAWGDVAIDGTLKGSLNVASVTKTGTGVYNVVFTTPMPNSEYSLVFGIPGFEAISNKTASGFTLTSNGTATPFDAPFSFAVHALNALPPRGTTGTDAWGTVQSTGTVDASFNIKSVTRTSQGAYDVVFTTPMPTAKYSVVGSTAGAAGDDIGFAVVSAPISYKSTTGFTFFTGVMNYGNGAYNAKDTDFNFTVNATDATLPQTITEEQIQAAINNPGASAWAKVDVSAATSNGVAGNIKAGNNITSVTRASGAGFFDVVFTTPMPSADYSIQLACDYSGISPAVVSTTANGFQFITASAGGVGVDVQEVFITVHATNALPPKGGTGTDSWAQVKADGTVLSSFNATVVKASGNGDYDITFVNPMPTANYAVTATVSGDPNVNYGYSCITNNQTADGFRISVVGDNSSDFTDNDFSFNVNATNATLPTSFTEEEIQAVVDLAKSGSANGATAWGSVQGDGTLNANLNIALVTTTATGEHDIVFSTPMPTVDYSVVGSTTGDNDYGYFYVKSKSTTGFTVNIRDASNTFTNYGFDFTVHSSNVTLPFTVTQTQIESFKSTVTALESAVTRINAIEANEIVDDSTDSALLTLIASLTNKVQLLESKIQTIEADHSTLMNNNNGGY